MIETLIWAVTVILCTLLLASAIYGRRKNTEGHVINIHNDISSPPMMVMGERENDEEDESEAWRRR